MVSIRCCRDCTNYEERRDIDGAALCKKKIGPYTCCEDFELKNPGLKADRLYNRFCAECVNFEDVPGTPTCKKSHVQGVACEYFTSRLRKLDLTRQNNLVKTALIVNAIKKKGNPELMPAFLIEVGRKIKW
jgi:hypothetical protein